MIRDMISSLARHILTLIAGVGLGSSLYDQATADVLVNGGIALITVIWSFIDKSKSSRSSRKEYN